MADLHDILEEEGSMRVVLNSLLVSAALTGCTSTQEPTEPTGTADQGLTGDNGVSLNGVSLNGVSLNGVSLNGVSLNGVSVNGVSVNGVSVNGVSLNGVSVNGVSVNGVSVNGVSVNGVSVNGVSLNGVSLNGVSLNGTDFIGAQMSGALTNGSTLPIRIDDIAALTDDNADVLAYAVSIETDDGWAPLCGYETDGSVKLALAVPGTWDLTTGAWTDNSDQFSFACRHASIAKCVEFGYKTWLGFSDHQHACVRMLRADYCGDGVPHTITGTPINLYDNAGVQLDTESWPVDAEWTPDGALCVNHNRGGVEPPCYAEKYSDSCGSFANGALLIDEYNGQ
ncbi:MAG TPA: ADYC domain-containing protein [Kofleriaceae bacterium]|nr:ADYC domain-containing protein [Kofleriaceae bacterium]